MKTNVMTRVLAVLARAPIWIRHDLSAKEETARRRAEETLAAMIASSLEADEGNE
ncbi:MULTISPECIES: DUF6771 family protein [Sphingobium]|uniref:DUF6771 family protein n=1 Tax=Sphingobium TaxID=165695 RepID=UPI001BE51480|nr:MULTISPECIES: DUF6771 family protein [Sphingobium]MBT2245036.1 hypothetical protein [Sphingobium sp. BHU LFT2]WBQ19395.1 hypothetical protein PAE53_23745 [Sphingobium yanoikuyae]